MIEFNRRGFVARAGALAAATSLGARSALAQSYPQRPIRVIVPYAAGGGTDVLSRLLAATLGPELGQTLVVENRGGGASVIGTQAVATAAPDGYTLGVVDSAFVTNPGLFKTRLPYDTRRDFIPISQLTVSQLLLVVPPKSPFKTVGDLVAYAKANPGKLTFGSAGIGTGIHLAGEQLRQVAGIDVVIVPYRGGGPSLADFIAGNVDFTFGSIPSLKAYVADGRARAIGVTRGRATQMPDVPSMEEAGFGAVDSATELGMIAPAKTPAPIVARLSELCVKAVRESALRQRLIDLGFQPVGSTAEEFRAHVDTEIDKWARIIAAANISPPD